MVWLWLIFPALLLGGAALLWQATVRIDRQRSALEGDLEALRATRPEPAPR